MDVVKTGGRISVKGNSCPRGVIYGEKEITTPERMVTTVKQYKGKTLSLKTNKPINKKLVEKVLKEIKSTPVTRSMSAGDVFIKDIFGTGVDIIVTGSPDK